MFVFQHNSSPKRVEELRLMPEYEQRMKKKIKMVLGVCVAHGTIAALVCGSSLHLSFTLSVCVSRR